MLHLLTSHRLVNGGILSPNDPKRRYKYHLVDPADKPYATIRFYYRPRAFLVAAGIITAPNSHARQTSTVSNYSGMSSSFSDSTSRSASKASSTRSPTGSEKSSATGSSRPGTPPTDSVEAWLRHHRLTKYTWILAPLSFGTLITLSDADLVGLGVAAKGSRGKLIREIEAYKQEHPQPVGGVDNDVVTAKEKSSTSPGRKTSPRSPSSMTSSQSSKSEYIGYFIGNPSGDAPLQIITKDSLENLAQPTPPTITLSAPAHKTTFTTEDAGLCALSTISLSAPAEKVVFSDEETKPALSTGSPKKTVLSNEEIKPAPSACKSPSQTALTSEELKPALAAKSPKKNHKSLKVEINGAEFELEKDAKRPLSPFTSAGRLRQLLSPRHPTPSAPAKITAFGPTINDEVGGKTTKMDSGSKPKGQPKIELKRTTRAERGGGILSRILKKRLGRG